MAVAVTAGVQHLPFGERSQYGSPYPEGIAVAHIDTPGDATGGALTFTFVADAGFLYRFEGFQWARGSEAPIIASCITSHNWASAKSGLGASSFDLNWTLLQDVAVGFAVFTIGTRSANQAGADVTGMIKRLPMGRLDHALLQQLFHVVAGANVDTVTNEVSLWLTYWRKEALSLPGFLSSFYEAPVVPTPLKVGA